MRVGGIALCCAAAYEPRDEELVEDPIAGGARGAQVRPAHVEDREQLAHL